MMTRVVMGYYGSYEIAPFIRRHIQLEEQSMEDRFIKPKELAERLGTSMDCVYPYTGLLLQRSDAP
jgi:hypothetical protein